jgi:hypothetical protein
MSYPTVQRYVLMAALSTGSACGASTPQAPAPAPSAVPGSTLSIEPPPVTNYKACLTALGGKTTQSPVLAEVATALLSAPSLPEPLRKRGLSLGAPYLPGHVNILVPSGAIDAVPAACSADPGFPTCWSHVDHGLVLCSAAMGRLLERPLYDPPIDLSVQFAARYFVAIALGHEIGHILEEDRSLTSHQLTDVNPAKLSCLPLDRKQEQLERRCDDHAKRLACEYLAAPLAPFRSPGRGPLADLSPLIALERIFDESWVGDRLCLSTYDYDSTATRVDRFGVSYLQCLSPTPDGPAVTVAEETAGALDAIERELRARQKAGWAGSPLFGKGALFSESAVLARDGIVLAAHSTGRASGIYVTRRGSPEAELQERPLVSLSKAASLLATAPTSDGARFFLGLQESPPQLLRIRVSCSSAALASCSATEERRSPVPRGALRRAGDGTWLRMRNAQLELYPNDDTFASAKPSISAHASFSIEPIGKPKPGELTGKVPLFVKPDSEDPDAITTGGVSAVESIGRAGAVTFRQAGLYVLELLDGGKGRAVVLPFPIHEKLNIVGLGFGGPRVAFLMAVRDRLELWDCPDQIIASKAPSSVQCIATIAPSIMSSSLPLITRDPALLDAISVHPAPRACVADAWEVNAGGWTWLVQSGPKRSWAAPAHGLAGCTNDRAITFRSGRIDEFNLDWAGADQHTVDLH